LAHKYLTEYHRFAHADAIMRIRRVRWTSWAERNFNAK
jgi:hypothetical protein